MDRYAIIKNEIIENVIVADANFVAANHLDAIQCPDFIGVGDKYKDGEFTRAPSIVFEDDFETL